MIAEEREGTETDPYLVFMVGDSTMSHQYGAICAFMGERDGRRYDPDVRNQEFEDNTVIVEGTFPTSETILHEVASVFLDVI